MKNIITTVATLLTAGFSFAHTPFVTTNSTYRSPDDKVAMDIQRSKGDVQLHIQLNEAAQYDQLIIERSTDALNYFASCKQLSASQIKGDNIQVDKYATAKDIYYRVKTISKDGVTRAYPAILLSATK
ncbi:MAG: hypothetical protein NTY88_06450 [Bacteroidetes bacterium]|nr:hypothetical protein [Bacteroidota bacterium]